MLELNTIYQGDVLEQLQSFPDECIQCVVTSPPFWNLRDYGVDGQIGLEDTPEEYVNTMVSVFQEVKRVLRKDGTVWLNLGDSYSAGKMTPHTGAARNGRDMSGMSGIIRTYNKPKNLVGIPWRVAFALQADGWILRQDIIWHKPNPMPESVTDRCTKAHEYIFLLSKNKKYHYDNESIKEPVSEVSLKRAEYGWDCDRPSTKNASLGGEGIHTKKMGTRFVNPSGRNKRSVWTINTQPYKDAHFAVFPSKIPELCIKAGTSEYGECSECGKAWERVTERDTDYQDGYGNMGAKGSKWLDEDKQSSGHRIQKNMNALRALGRDHDNPFPQKTTIGWQPTCSCDADRVPQIVLDPFFGSGTTGWVAQRLGRKWIGIELSEDYIKIAEKRLAQKEIFA